MKSVYFLGECELNHTLSHSTTHSPSPDHSTYLWLLSHSSNINREQILIQFYLYNVSSPSLFPSYSPPSPPACTVYRIRYNFPHLGPVYSPISPVKYNLIWSHSIFQLCLISYLRDTAKNIPSSCCQKYSFTLECPPIPAIKNPKSLEVQVKCYFLHEALRPLSWN